MIPMHAMATANPQQLRWAIAPEYLPAGGTVRQAPGKLGALLDSGVIAELTVRAADVSITLSEENNWRDLGADIQQALDEALRAPADWRVETLADSDAQLTEIVAELLAGPIGALAESHGGSIELMSVNGNDVLVRVSGACHGCPASGSTIHDRLQHELRRRLKVTVRSENYSLPLSLGKKLLSFVVSRQTG